MSVLFLSIPSRKILQLLEKKRRMRRLKMLAPRSSLRQLCSLMEAMVLRPSLLRMKPPALLLQLRPKMSAPIFLFVMLLLILRMITWLLV